MPESPAADSDEDLVRRVRAGDDAAATLLHDRCEPLLRARARRRLVGGLRRRLGASDIVQEAFAAAFERLDAFEDQGPGSFRRWMETILDHKASDLMKRHVTAGKRSVRREASGALGSSDAGPAGRDATPSVVVVRAEEREALRRAIEGLDGDDRLVLDLVNGQGQDFAEAGRRMGRSAEAARKLFGRAVLRLGRRLRRSPW